MKTKFITMKYFLVKEKSGYFSVSKEIPTREAKGWNFDNILKHNYIRNIGYDQSHLFRNIVVFYNLVSLDRDKYLEVNAEDFDIEDFFKEKKDVIMLSQKVLDSYIQETNKDFNIKIEIDKDMSKASISIESKEFNDKFEIKF